MMSVPSRAVVLRSSWYLTKRPSRYDVTMPTRFSAARWRDTSGALRCHAHGVVKNLRRRDVGGVDIGFAMGPVARDAARPEGGTREAPSAGTTRAGLLSLSLYQARTSAIRSAT